MLSFLSFFKCSLFCLQESDLFILALKDRSSIPVVKPARHKLPSAEQSEYSHCHFS